MQKNIPRSMTVSAYILDVITEIDFCSFDW